MVPIAIGRPDYADHKLGHPLSELAVKGSSQIKVLDDVEIEGKIKPTIKPMLCFICWIF